MCLNEGFEGAPKAATDAIFAATLSYRVFGKALPK
jgi:hypothetical protein